MFEMRVRSLCLFFAARYAAPGNFVIVYENQSNGFGVDAVLFTQNFLGKRSFSVVIFNGNRGLQNDGASIEIFVYKVHRATGKFCAVIQSLFLRFESGEGWQQRRMNIQDAIGKRGYK